MTIVEFLEARIAEDEAASQMFLRSLERQVSENYEGMTDERGPMTPDRLFRATMWARYDGATRDRDFATGQHIADMAGPARVLAECAAKRKIVQYAAGLRLDRTRDAETDAQYRSVWWTLWQLATVYASHPDYQQEWSL